MRWQRSARWALALFLVALVGGIWAGVSRRRTAQPAAPPPSARTDPAAASEASAGSLITTLATGQKRVIRYERMLQYPDGRMRLLAVEGEIPQRGGRSLAVRADQAEVGANESAVTLRGHVELRTSDGVTATTEEASYTEGEGVVRAPGAVRFSRKRLSGSGVGLTYDQHRDVLWLLAEAHVEIEPDAQGRGGATIVAGAAGFARADHYARFEKGVSFARGGQTMTSAEAMAYLSEDEDRVHLVELRGGSSIEGQDAAPGGFRSMAARDINLQYAPEGQALERAVAFGDGRIEIAGQSRGQVKRIAAEWLDLGLAADGATVTSLSGRDRVQLELPAEGTSPARVIRSGAVGATGAPAQGITSAGFSEGVEFRETGSSGAAMVARSSGLAVQLKPGFGDLQAAHFVGGVRFERDTMRGRAKEGHYDVATGRLVLTGSDETTGAPPEVVDERATIKGTRLDITLDGRGIVATGAVNTLMRPAPKPSGAGGPTAAAPEHGLFTGEEPTQAMADALSYDGRSRRAVYTGKVRLWQGSTRVEGDRVEVDDQRGDLSASGSVRTAMLAEQTDETSGKPEKVPTTGRALEFTYRDEERHAVYTKEAHVVGPQGDLGSDRIELFLSAQGRKVDRLEAFAAVRLQTPDGRVATGARLSYTSNDERYVMGGSPVKVVDSCGTETTGRALTFFRSADRIIVDGNEETRTQTKGSGKCPAAVKD